ncbi:NosD domain-containing protein [Motiliproteus sediminis]|uniref:NosD domain-containing protein n=1 Tax=Motiliproteus sediminis TaxID=1468178 RepID=UPI001AEFF596|nr:NosD domain-containing protein [Motiliproteus sediminis]
MPTIPFPYLRPLQQLLALLLAAGSPVANAAVITVSTPASLHQALASARAGDEVVLRPGIYPLQRFESHHGGTAAAPIRLVARPPHQAIIQARRQETFSIYHPHWQFEDLVIRGTATTEHAFHLSENADDIMIRNNQLIDFHSHIKANGKLGAFPDRGVIEGNLIYNRAPRETSAPVSPIDIVGGRDWVIRANTLRDFGGRRQDQIAYGVFLKGNSRNGLIERNLVICADQHQGGWRIGLSLGGGGTAPPYCEQQDCSYEHRNGVIRNNVVLNCSDAGIYLKRASASLIEHNTLLLTRGVDVQLSPSSAVIRRNLIDGVIEARKGGRIKASDNVINSWNLYARFDVAAARLSHRISDYPAKYPSVFSQGFIAWLQQRLEASGRWLAESPLGLGHSGTRRQLPAINDANLAGLAEEALWRPELSPTLASDFWGRQRPAKGVYVGAIDLRTSACNLQPRIASPLQPSTLPCLQTQK